MKASELRIGNWVEPITKSPCTITGINYQRVKDGDIIFIYADYESFLPEHIQPIPLTEEWLLKFGFERGNNEYCIDLHPKTWGFLTIEIMDFSWSIDKEKWDNTIPSDQCKCVHQLQNLYFALTGTELEFG